MIRRSLLAEPTSRLALWSGRLGVFSIPVMLLAIVIVRSGILDIVPALATFGGALALAAAAIVLAVAAFVGIWTDGLKGLGQAVLGLLIGTFILAYPAYLGIRGYRLPMLNDITTDVVDPPRFETIARLRSRDANSISYAGSRLAELQHNSYPKIEPLLVSVTPQVAYEAVLATINKHRWRVVDARAPQAGRHNGIIEAVARTPIMGFRDDLAVRVRPDEAGARIDVRSASRYGRHDFGTNASRIRSLLEEIDDVVGNQEELLKKAAAKPAKAEQNSKKPQPATRR
jgi:uncharacterized protein (DUF1499 family)